MKRGLVDGILVAEGMTWLGRLQMVDELVFAAEASTRDAAWASIDVAEEARGQAMDGLDVSGQIAFAGVVFGSDWFAEATPMSTCSP